VQEEAEALLPLARRLVLVAEGGFGARWLVDNGVQNRAAVAEAAIQRCTQAGPAADWPMGVATNNNLKGAHITKPCRLDDYNCSVSTQYADKGAATLCMYTAALPW